MVAHRSCSIHFALSLAAVWLDVLYLPTVAGASSTQQDTDDVQFLQVATHQTTITGTVPFFRHNDSIRLLNSKHHSQYAENRMPRVLLYTWCDQNGLSRFGNEFYWKRCYAHMHGFDLVISSVKNVSGVKKMSERWIDHPEQEKWYQEDLMWAWVADIRTYVSSGQYDYVFFTGGDVLMNKMNLWFPVWAYDKGHDITVMDQGRTDFGLNENAILFKASNASLDILDAFFELRKDFWMQSDNGAWMETLLKTIGRDSGTEGYKNKCTALGKLEKSAAYMNFNNEHESSTEHDQKYAACFFQELDRLAGEFGNRSSKSIGFSKAGSGIDGGDEMPWANCYSYVRDTWPDCDRNCLAFHWNGPKNFEVTLPVDATCPDLSFQWDGAPLSYEDKPEGRINIVAPRM